LGEKQEGGGEREDRQDDLFHLQVLTARAWKAWNKGT
jgi:hypothetical protein